MITDQIVKGNRLLPTAEGVSYYDTRRFRFHSRNTEIIDLITNIYQLFSASPETALKLCH